MRFLVPYRDPLAPEPANDYLRQPMVRQMDGAELAEIIARGLADQGLELDNDGDGETVLLLDPRPAINLRRLADAIAAAIT